jgi:hypothetical protein
MLKQISRSEFVHDAYVMWISQKSLFRRPKKQVFASLLFILN